MNVLFRCDGDSRIGAGHLARCSALAREITRRGGHAAIVCRAVPASLSWATAGARTITVAPGDWDDPGGDDASVGRSDAGLLLEWAGRWRADWIFIDHYGANQAYLEAVGDAGYRLAVLDDCGERDMRAASLVVNPNLGAESIHHDVARGAALYLGPAFAPLRPEFSAAREQLGEELLARRFRLPVERVFVGFGGSRLGNHAGAAVAAIRAWDDAPDVSVASALDAAAVAAAMSQSGLAISASGSTVWELCCLGVPSVVWPLADNQRGIARALERAGAAAVVHGIGEALAAARELRSSPAKRLALGKTAWELVDGRGAERVVDGMEKRMGDRWRAKVPLPVTDSISGAGEIPRR